MLACGWCSVHLSTSTLTLRPMSIVFLVATVAFALALFRRRRQALVMGLVMLLLTALMFRYHLTDVIKLSL